MTCDRIALTDVTSARWFSENYGNRRWPVVIKTNGLHNLGWTINNWNNATYLKDLGGKGRVMVMVPAVSFFFCCMTTLAAARFGQVEMRSLNTWFSFCGCIILQRGCDIFM